VPSDHVAEERFSRLYSAYEREVYAYCLRRTDRDAALDCAAETFLVAWRRIDDVPLDDVALRWLYRVAHNVIGDYYRMRSRRRGLQQRISAEAPTSRDDEPETVVVRNEIDSEVFAAVSRLRSGDRQVLLLAAWEQLPHTEIAEIAGCSVHAVDQRIHRATKRLAKELRRSRGTMYGMTTLRSESQGGD
jgi:RNA polymerase sigma factor (sigma-70 family)